jgi:peptidoglycan hydrolase-like amidase
VARRGWRYKDTIEEANEYKAGLSEKGFADVAIVTEKKTQPSDDAVALSNQLKTGGKSEVRSLIKPTGSSQPTNAPISANLREVIVSGASESARFSSLKSVAFGSQNERVVPVRLNGKAYRGRIEVFVNSRGTLTVVNVVSLEDYLLGVVPNELSLPSIEAQKAQAVAARTYAVANINGFGSQGFDLLPTIRSQVYNGVSSENSMGTRAVLETRGVVATYKGKPITAYYTSTCGGRTENSETFSITPNLTCAASNARSKVIAIRTVFNQNRARSGEIARRTSSRTRALDVSACS